MSTLLVCSVGGHLAELSGLVSRLPGIGDERLWVTFDTPQSRSLLAGEQVMFLDYTGPRDVINIARHTRQARRLLRGAHPFETAISTGSGIALSFLPLARVRGICCHYIESFTRIDGPSATGRVLARIPGIHLYTQHGGWAGGRWRYSGCILDAYSPSLHDAGTNEIQRVVVTLGTMEDYAFPRLIESALAVLPSSASVLWQVGCTDVSGLGIEAHRTMSAARLSAEIAAADVVIAHAGSGSAFTALEAGKMPLLVPRRAARGENVDDHQLELAAELHRRGLAVVREVDELTVQAVQQAAAGAVLNQPRAAPFPLAA